MNIAYVRVSTVEQNEARQIDSLKKFVNIEALNESANDKVLGENRWYVEKVSAKDTNRPKLKEMLEFARKGDTIYVHDFSRLARSTKDLLDIVEQLKRKDVNLVSNKENIDSSTPTGKLMLTMIGAINEFERMNLLERQREGISIAVKEGKYKGRKEVNLKDFDIHYKKYINRSEGYKTKTELAKQLKITRPTLDKLIKQYEAKAGK